MSDEKKVEKAVMAVSADRMVEMKVDGADGRRGISVYTLSELMGAQAKTKDGSYVEVKYQQPLFVLSVHDRVEIFKKCSPVFGVVSSRMNRISALEWNIVPDKKNEDKIADELKMKYGVWKDFNGSEDLKYKVAAQLIIKDIQHELVDVLPDMSNFQTALSRWSRRIKSTKQDVAESVEDWLSEPNQELEWSDFIKEYVFDLLVHGATALYKDYLENRLENLFILPGGSVMPIHNEFVGGATGYLQAIYGYEPQVFFSDELSFLNYIPTSSRSYGMIPLEALTNKVAESLLFDQLMAEQADGTKVPEKLVIFGDNSPFGDIAQDISIPMDKGEQKKIETVINEARKGAVRTLSGVGMPVILDLSRADTMSTQMERQKMIREEVALVYNMSNLEINMSDSDGVSGRATSDSLETIDQNKGVVPIVQSIMDKFNREIVPYRVGNGYKLEFQISKDPMQELEYHTKMIQSGLYSTNEIRTDELGKDPYPEEEFDRPQSSQASQGGEMLGGEEEESRGVF